MQYLLLFLEGILTFVSPCMLPMIPLYLSYFAGKEHQKQVAFKEAVLFMLGFSAIFILMSVFVSTFGRWLLVYQQAINFGVGVILMLLAIDIWFDHHWSHQIRSLQIQSLSPTHSFIFGILFAITWTPCVGVYLASALAISMVQETLWQSIALIMVYCLGLGIPFIISALLVEESQKIISQFKRKGMHMQKVAAVILFIFGLSICFGWVTPWLQG